jgi:DNA-binding NarL/FixJ family response regulator
MMDGRWRAYDQPVRVLVVDDVARVRERMVGMLAEIAGVTAVFEADGIVTAIEALRARAPDVVVLDLHLNGESGLTLATLVKRDRPDALLIVMTCQPTEPVRRLSEALGVDYFFDKSSAFEDVLRVVAEAVGPTRALATSDA